MPALWGVGAPRTSFEGSNEKPPRSLVPTNCPGRHGCGGGSDSSRVDCWVLCPTLSTGFTRSVGSWSGGFIYGPEAEASGACGTMAREGGTTRRGGAADCAIVLRLICQFGWQKGVVRSPYASLCLMPVWGKRAVRVFEGGRPVGEGSDKA